MTFPAEAKAQLELPGSLDARVLVQHRPSGAIVAEVQKAAGAPVRLAFMAGDYDAVVGQKSGIAQCRFTLSDDHVMVLDTSSCTPVTPVRTAAKGEDEPELTMPPDEARGPTMREADRWAIEASAGFIWRQTDAFTDRLQEFGYQRQTSFFELPTGRFTLGVSRILVPHIAGALDRTRLTEDNNVGSDEER